MGKVRVGESVVQSSVRKRPLSNGAVLSPCGSQLDTKRGNLWIIAIPETTLELRAFLGPRDIGDFSASQSGHIPVYFSCQLLIIVCFVWGTVYAHQIKAYASYSPIAMITSFVSLGAIDITGLVGLIQNLKYLAVKKPTTISCYSLEWIICVPRFPLLPNKCLLFGTDDATDICKLR